MTRAQKGRLKAFLLFMPGMSGKMMSYNSFLSF